MGSCGRDWAARIFPQVPEAQLVACVDQSRPALAEALATVELCADRFFSTLDAALDAVPADAVLVTTDLPSHVEVDRRALLAGKHVLSEKPLAPSIKEGRDLAELAERAGRTFMVSQNYRYFPAVQAVREIVRDGSMGRALRVELDFRRFSNPLSSPASRNRRWTEPLLLDMAIHHFDLLRAVLGREPDSVFCATRNPAWADYQDPPEGHAMVRFGDAEDHVDVSYRGSWICPDRMTWWAGEWRMVFEEGELWWTSRASQRDASHDAVRRYDHAGGSEDLTLPDLPLIDRAGALDAFVKAVEEGREPETSGRDNLRSLALSHAAIESARRGTAVAVAEVLEV